MKTIELTEQEFADMLEALQLAQTPADSTRESVLYASAATRLYMKLKPVPKPPPTAEKVAQMTPKGQVQALASVVSAMLHTFPHCPICLRGNAHLHTPDCYASAVINGILSVKEG